MSATKNTGLPNFRTIDVRTIKGDPVYKFVHKNPANNEGKEEWVYFQEDKRERFFFENDLLADYQLTTN